MKKTLQNIIAVLPYENSYKSEKTTIFIDGDTIAAIGDKPSNFVPDEIIDGNGGIATAGFVNCHAHTYMSLFRNLADDLPFEEWLFKRVSPMEDSLTDEDAYWGAMLACMEMLKTGTTTFLDMHMFKHQTIKAAVDTGIRAVISRGLVGFGRNDEGGIKRLNEAKEEIERWQGNEKISFMLGPHALYTTDTEYLELVSEEAKRLNLPIHIHLSETRYEVKQTREKTGMSQFELLSKIGLLDSPTVAAHCVHIDERDMDIIKAKNISIAHCPKSNLKLANGFAPIAEMQKKGINICLGTDSAASNNALNMFSEMNFCSLNNKGLTENPLAVTANDALRFATANGGKALRLNTGKLSVGMKADITVLNADSYSLCPAHNYPAAMVYSCNGSEVDKVMVGGELVVDNGQLTKFDEHEIIVKCNEIIKRLENK